jgi:hypothetical protein
VNAKHNKQRYSAFKSLFSHIGLFSAESYSVELGSLVVASCQRIANFAQSDKRAQFSGNRDAEIVPSSASEKVGRCCRSAHVPTPFYTSVLYQ